MRSESQPARNFLLLRIVAACKREICSESINIIFETQPSVIVISFSKTQNTEQEHCNIPVSVRRSLLLRAALYSLPLPVD